MQFRIGSALFVLATAARGTALAQIQSCQVAKVLPESLRRQEQLGQGVAAGGEYVLIGDPGNRFAYLVGAAKLCRRIGLEWRLVEVFRATDAWGATGFGHPVCLSADATVAVVGASYEPVPERIDGSVYVYERESDGSWRWAAKLTADEPDLDPPLAEFFGAAIAVDADTILVGAYQNRSAYVFERSPSGDWLQTARLTPSINGWYFGYSVALSGDTAVIGAPNDFTNGQYAGAAFVFERDASGAWNETAQLLPSFGHQQVLGWSVAIDAYSILVGVPGDRTQGSSAGAIYAYRRGEDRRWVECQRLYAPNPAPADAFGNCIALHDGVAVAGATGYSGPMFGYGAAFVFELDADAVWQSTSTLMAADPHDGSRFGYSIGLSDHFAIVGAPFQDESGIEDTGAAYVFAVGPDSDANGVMDVCECRAYGDLTLDGAIDMQDLIVLLASFGLDSAADLDADGDTDIQDLARLLARFGMSCP